MFNIILVCIKLNLATRIRLVGPSVPTQKVLFIFTMQKRFSSSIMHKILQLNLFQRIFTDVDLYDSASRRMIDLHIGVIEEFIDSNHIPIPEKTDLVLDINLDTDGTYVTDYYFANHQLRIIFFLDHFSSESIRNWGEIDGVSSGRHLRMSCAIVYSWMVRSHLHLQDMK